ncbi:DUF2254 domain-containing protein [Deinococcus sp.]|uniref:DUF2254 domain-containing protein n=1 Tax=Deinococcus sp. TaxID=47478 RepID=UPI002869A92F|nr:DUF2254 domain-containing protein [Deinococcus sp.]
MKRLQLRLRQLTREFWFVPAVMTLIALVLAELGIKAEERYGIPDGLKWVYTGGESGARSVLGAIASSAIGVAGTVFSITIAALSYAAGSMGPRLLDNFTRDRGNQLVLGTFIATFAFTLYTLRSVQGGDPSPFVPHYNVTFGLLLALLSVAALVYYLAHVTGNINMTTVVNLLRDDLRTALRRATNSGDTEPAQGPPPPAAFWEHGQPLRAPTSGYLQLVDTEMLIHLATEEDTAIHLHVRAGDYVFPNAVIATAVPTLPGGIMDALTLGDKRVEGQDLEYSVRQMAEVAARALSPGVNDPVTAIDVIDRFGDALCSLHDRRWPEGVHYVDHQLRLVAPTTDFGGLTDTMFHMIRQYGADSPAVAVRLLEVLRTVASCMHDPERHAHLRRHAALVHEDALRAVSNSGDRSDITARYAAFLAEVDSHDETDPDHQRDRRRDTRPADAR